MGTEPQAADDVVAGETAITGGPRSWPIEVRPNGTVIFDGIAIGGLDFTNEDADGKGCEGLEIPRLTLNLGWMRAAGMRITIEGDPRVDRNRTGIVLER